MSLPIWTPAALASEARRYAGSCWRLVEAQHRVSTMKLVDSLEEQALLEDELELSKPPMPPECRRLHYLLATPFRYGRYPGNSRFRREGYSPGVYYASEKVETAVAETAFYRLLFFAESPDTPWPHNPLEFTGFKVRFTAETALDLTEPPFAAHEESWSRLSDHSACLDLADAARQAEIEAIRYASVRDPQRRANIALLTCRAFAESRPSAFVTWRLALSHHGVAALCDRPDTRLDLPLSLFAADPRLSTLTGPVVQRP